MWKIGVNKILTGGKSPADLTSESKGRIYFIDVAKILCLIFLIISHQFSRFDLLG